MDAHLDVFLNHADIEDLTTQISAQIPCQSFRGSYTT